MSDEQDILKMFGNKIILEMFNKLTDVLLPNFKSIHESLKRIEDLLKKIVEDGIRIDDIPQPAGWGHKFGK